MPRGEEPQFGVPDDDKKYFVEKGKDCKQRIEHTLTAKGAKLLTLEGKPCEIDVATTEALFVWLQTYTLTKLSKVLAENCAKIDVWCLGFVFERGAARVRGNSTWVCWKMCSCFLPRRSFPSRKGKSFTLDKVFFVWAGVAFCPSFALPLTCCKEKKVFFQVWKGLSFLRFTARSVWVIVMRLNFKTPVYSQSERYFGLDFDKFVFKFVVFFWITLSLFLWWIKGVSFLNLRDLHFGGVFFNDSSHFTSIEYLHLTTNTYNLTCNISDLNWHLVK